MTEKELTYAESCAAFGRAYDAVNLMITDGPKFPEVHPGDMLDGGRLLSIEEETVWQFCGSALAGALQGLHPVEAHVLPAPVVKGLTETLKDVLAALQGLTDLRVANAMQDGADSVQERSYVMLLNGTSSVTKRHALESAQERRADMIRPGDVLTRTWQVVKHVAEVEPETEALRDAASVLITFKDETNISFFEGEKIMSYRPEW